MPKIEVDEVQFQQDAKLREVVQNIMKHPKARLLVQEAHQMVDPNAAAPELEMRKIVDEPVSALTKKLDEVTKQLADDKADREKKEKLDTLSGTIEAGIAKIRRENSLTAKGEETLRALMNDKGILDPEIAWAYIEKQTPPAAPTMPGGTGSWNFLEVSAGDGSDDIKRLIESKGENEGLLQKMANEAIQEVRASSRR